MSGGDLHLRVRKLRKDVQTEIDNRKLYGSNHCDLLLVDSHIAKHVEEKQSDQSTLRAEFNSADIPGAWKWPCNGMSVTLAHSSDARMRHQWLQTLFNDGALAVQRITHNEAYLGRVGAVQAFR